MLKPVQKIIRRLAGGSGDRFPVWARHIEHSAILSADDDPAFPSERLFDLALQAVGIARSTSMHDIVKRMNTTPHYPNVWPGEHYKLLAGLVAVCQPQVIVEIGTAQGLSALALRQTMPAKARLVTFDLIPWDNFPDTVLRADDFADGSFSQILADVSDSGLMRQHAELFQSADLIFADGPKDGRFEQVLLERFAEIGLPKRPLIVLDDIRVWNMLAIWRGITKPKLDLTSFGHWSGTGLVDWV